MRVPVCLIVAMCLVAPLAAAADQPDDLDLLVSWMTGSFSSAAQARTDPAFFDIRLHMTPIWTDRSDGRWLYVEQAAGESPDQPYRQRVYHVTQVAPGLFESRVLALPEPSLYVGAWRDAKPLGNLKPEDLLDRTGCAILMRRRDDAFIGGTLGTLCTSSLRGATYATSQVVITATRFTSWDRGFDASNTQVWGATTGGYVFDRVMEPAEPLETSKAPASPEE